MSQAHKLNLAVEALNKLPIVATIEDMLGDLYSFFCKSPKKHLEFLKLAEVMETKGNKILRNIKTRWISMLAPSIRVMNEYRTLIAKLERDSKAKKAPKITTDCFEHLCDVQIVLGLSCIMPMLRAVSNLMKYAQSNSVFVCDFLAAVKILQKDLIEMYAVGDKTAYTQPAFWDFNALVSQTHDSIPMKWTSDELDLNASGVEYLTFEPKDCSIKATFRDPVTKTPIPVTREVWTCIIDSIKAQASGVFPLCLCSLEVHVCSCFQVSTTSVYNDSSFGLIFQFLGFPLDSGY
jgi:hypothetical protein